ncbi:MAG: NAD(P)-dependent glycerol-3-phosphate dehydrogenase [Alphaproteobacteria bacterium]|nr:NAD(P)-dependent glycerol-3-phosphate dehydrogenase [Alphaproteobacteria bacterium]
MNQKIGVIGAGAWGCALAQTLASAGKDVILWAREPEVVTSINDRHENRLFLPGVTLHQNIRATASLSDAAQGDILLIVTPAQHIRTTLEGLKHDLSSGKPFVICAKGMEIQSGLLLSQVAKEILPDQVPAVLTGPTFASEIARGLPCAVTVGIADKDIGQQIVEGIKSKTLRPYLNDDVIGAQVGGAVKNVIAIAAGVIQGRGMGESARAALVTRGLAEMSRLASAMGGKKETLMGMCGVGDMILTCSSMQSRNFSLGMALGQGQRADEILKTRSSVTEGVHTAKALKVLAKNNAVDMPISFAVDACLSEGADISTVIEAMMDRPLRAEGI